MKEKKFVGKWVDDMNIYQKKKIEISKKRDAFDTFFTMFDSVKEVISKNWFMFTVSTLVAIPLLIVLVYMFNYVISNINDLKEIRSIFGLSGAMLVAPFICLYIYFIHILSAKRLPTLKVFLNLILVALLMLNIRAGIDSIKLMEANKEMQGNLIFSVIFLDTYTISFMLTKLCFLLYKNIVTKIKKIADWVVEDNQENDEILKAKLSFINKIITGFLAIVASILGLILTLNKIL